MEPCQQGSDLDGLAKTLQARGRIGGVFQHWVLEHIKEQSGEWCCGQ
jgi:hypothetical protein